MTWSALEKCRKVKKRKAEVMQIYAEELKGEGEEMYGPGRAKRSLGFEWSSIWDSIEQICSGGAKLCYGKEVSRDGIAWGSQAVAMRGCEMDMR